MRTLNQPMRGAGSLWVVLLGTMGCTDASLFESPGLGDGPIDNKLSIQSQFCTEDPAKLDFPVKIVFAIDTSSSISITDPAAQRLVALTDVVDAFLPEPGVEFAVVQFAGTTNVLTKNAQGEDGFTRVRSDIDDAIVRLGVVGGTTDYEGALSNVFRIISADAQDSDTEDLVRSKYVVIFLSDGLPNPVFPPNNTRSAILDVVADIAELKTNFRLADVVVHTALVLGGNTGFRCTDSGLEGGNAACNAATTPPTCRGLVGCEWVGVEQEAESLMSAMSRVGNEGSFRSFRNGEEINFLRIDFTSIRRVFTLKSLVASNASARPRLLFRSDLDRVGRASPDSDGDGLDDEEEAQFGTEPLLRDTDGDGFGDFLEVRLASSGFDPLDPTDADCSLDVDRQDSDGDSLRDCEERFVGTNRDLVDSDADGMPDVVELHNGTNPVADDTRQDLDFDSARNGDEIRGHSDPAVNDAARRSAIAYRYDIKSRTIDELPPDDPRVAEIQSGRSCYDFRIDNVTLADTIDSGRNRVYVYINQAPFDNPQDFGLFRIACVEQTFIFPDFRDPPYPDVAISADAFKDPLTFNPDTDCVFGQPPPRNEE
jgi:hypothetical protein